MTHGIRPIEEMDKVTLPYTSSTPEPRIAKPGVFPFLRMADITYDPGSERWTVAGLLPAQGLAVIYGKQKSKKTFTALDIGMAVATGRPWAGLETAKGPVILIVGEGARGMCKRIAAYRKHRNIPDDTPLALVSARPNLGDGRGDLAKVMATIDAALGGVKPQLIILDTLSRMIGGADENGDGMRNFVNNAEELSEHFKCLVLAVHHEPHSAERMRGSTVLPGAMVAGLHVKKVSNLESTIELQEAKDGEDGLTFKVTFQVVELHDHDASEGKPATTLLVESVIRDDDRAEKPVKRSQWQLALDVLHDCLADYPVTRPNRKDFPPLPMTSVTRFRQELVTRAVTDDAGSGAERTAWSRIKKELQRRGLLRVRGDYCWCPVTREKGV